MNHVITKIANNSGMKGSSDIYCIGNQALLKPPLLGLFCSVKCPGKIILQACDYMQELKKQGKTVLSGFDSPVEAECLNILLSGTQPVIYCPSKYIHEKTRFKPEIKKAVAENRLLITSPFPEKDNRISTRRSKQRNQFIAKIADEILILYAEPGGKTDKLFQTIQSWGKPVYSFDPRLIELGALRIIMNDDLKTSGCTDMTGHVVRSI